MKQYTCRCPRGLMDLMSFSLFFFCVCEWIVDRRSGGSNSIVRSVPPVEEWRSCWRIYRMSISVWCWGIIVNVGFHVSSLHMLVYFKCKYWISLNWGFLFIWKYNNCFFFFVQLWGLWVDFFWLWFYGVYVMTTVWETIYYEDYRVLSLKKITGNIIPNSASDN